MQHCCSRRYLCILSNFVLVTLELQQKPIETVVKPIEKPPVPAARIAVPNIALRRRSGDFSGTEASKEANQSPSSHTARSSNSESEPVPPAAWANALKREQPAEVYNPALAKRMSLIKNPGNPTGASTPSTPTSPPPNVTASPATGFDSSTAAGGTSPQTEPSDRVLFRKRSSRTLVVRRSPNRARTDGIVDDEQSAEPSATAEAKVINAPARPSPLNIQATTRTAPIGLKTPRGSLPVPKVPAQAADVKPQSNRNQSSADLQLASNVARNSSVDFSEENSEVAELRQKLSAADQASSAAQARIAALESQLSQSLQATEKSAGDALASKDTEAALKERIAVLEHQLMAANQATATANETLAANQASTTSLNERAAALEQQLEAALLEKQRANKDKQAHLVTAQQVAATANESIIASQSAQSALNDRIASLEQQLKSAVQAAQRAEDQKQASIAALERQITGTQQSSTKTEEEIANTLALQQRVEFLEYELKSADDELHEAENDLRESLESNNKLTATLTDARQRLETIMAAHNDHLHELQIKDEQLATLQRQLDLSARRSSLSGEQMDLHEQRRAQVEQLQTLLHESDAQLKSRTADLHKIQALLGDSVATNRELQALVQLMEATKSETAAEHAAAVNRLELELHSLGEALEKAQARADVPPAQAERSVPSQVVTVRVPGGVQPADFMFDIAVKVRVVPSE